MSKITVNFDLCWQQNVFRELYNLFTALKISNSYWTVHIDTKITHVTVLLYKTQVSIVVCPCIKCEPSLKQSPDITLEHTTQLYGREVGFMAPDLFSLVLGKAFFIGDGEVLITNTGAGWRKCLMWILITNTGVGWSFFLNINSKSWENCMIF